MTTCAPPLWRICSRRLPLCCLAVAGMLVAAAGCAPHPPTSAGAGTNPGSPTAAAGNNGAAKAPRLERVAPLSGVSAPVPAGLAALRTELTRAMTELGQKAQPPPYFISYEVFDRNETVISASYGALVQSSSRRTRLLDTDVRVGSYKLDSTHPLRSDSFDFGDDAGEGRAVALPFADDVTVMRAVAWLDTDRKYKAAAEAFVKIRTQRTLKTAEEDESDDFSREKPVTFIGPVGTVGFTGITKEQWEERLRRLSARFRGHPRIHDSQVTLQVSTINRWIVNSEGALVQDGRDYIRVFFRPTRAPTTAWIWSASKGSTPRRSKAWPARRRWHAPPTR